MIYTPSPSGQQMISTTPVLLGTYSTSAAPCGQQWPAGGPPWVLAGQGVVWSAQPAESAAIGSAGTGACNMCLALLFCAIALLARRRTATSRRKARSSAWVVMVHEGRLSMSYQHASRVRSGREGERKRKRKREQRKGRNVLAPTDCRTGRTGPYRLFVIWVID